jgi:hypothetical protein
MVLPEVFLKGKKSHYLEIKYNHTQPKKALTKNLSLVSRESFYGKPLGFSSYVFPPSGGGGMVSILLPSPLLVSLFFFPLFFSCFFQFLAFLISPQRRLLPPSFFPFSASTHSPPPLPSTSDELGISDLVSPKLDLLFRINAATKRASPSSPPASLLFTAVLYISFGPPLDGTWFAHSSQTSLFTITASH